MTITQSADLVADGFEARLPDATNHTTGGPMNTTATRQTPSTRDILDVFQAILTVSQHPGIREVTPYGPGVGGIEGVKVRFEWDAGYLWAYLAGNDLDKDGKPYDRKPERKPFLPTGPWAPVPDPKSESGFKNKWLVVDYVLKFVYDLLEAARPGMFAEWESVGLRNVGLDHGPNGIRVTTASGTKLVVRVTIGSGPNRDPEDNPWPDYTIPTEGIEAWNERLQDIRKAPATLSSATNAVSVSAS